MSENKSDDTTQEKSWLDERMEDPAFRLSFAQEWASLRLCEQIENAMEAQNLTRSGLAKKLGKSRAFVTQALRRGKNLTIKTIVEMSHALGLEVEVVLRPQQRAVHAESSVEVFAVADRPRPFSHHGPFDLGYSWSCSSKPPADWEHVLWGIGSYWSSEGREPTPYVDVVSLASGPHRQWYEGAVRRGTVAEGFLEHGEERLPRGVALSS